MQFPQTVEYALRAMACLAACGDDGSVSMRASDLAVRTAIPTPYLSKIMRRLVTAGLVDSQRGHGGGFVLTRAPSKITLRDVLSAIGYDADSEECLFGWETCDGRNPCPLHDAWSSLKGSFDHWATSTTLASVRRTAKLGPPRPSPLPIVKLAPERPKASRPRRRQRAG